MPSWYARCGLAAVLAVACDSEPTAPPAPPAPPRTAGTVTASATAVVSSAPSAAPMGSAERQALAQRLRALVPASMPAACKLKPVRSDAPPWLKHNPEVSSERSFIDGFVEVALPKPASPHGAAPDSAQASQIESALYLVYEEGGAQTGLFAFGFASRDMASFASELFQRSSPKDPDRFLLEQREDLLLVQWTDGKKGPCWEALSAHRTKSAKP